MTALLYAALGVAIVAIVWLTFTYLSALRKLQKTESELRDMMMQINDRAMALLEGWKQREMLGIEENQRKLAREQALLDFAQWKVDFEGFIRQDAIRRSSGVILGQVTEHFVPYLPDFPFNPKDARFLGSPLDFLVFDGLSEGQVRSIVFVEVKTGNASLTTRERRIRDAVQAGNVRWMVIRPPLNGRDVLAIPESVIAKVTPAVEDDRLTVECSGCGQWNSSAALFCSECGDLLAEE